MVSDKAKIVKIERMTIQNDSYTTLILSYDSYTKTYTLQQLEDYGLTIAEESVKGLIMAFEQMEAYRNE